MPLRIRRLVVVAALAGLSVAGCGGHKPPRAGRPDPGKFYQRGLGHLHAGRPDLASVEFERTLALDPEDTLAMYALGLAYFGMRQFDRASLTVDKILVKDPYFGEAHSLRGLLYLEAKDRARARAEFERVLADKRYQTPHVAQHNIGRIALEEGKLDQALEYLRAAAVAKPENADYRYFHGLVLEQLRQFDLARKEFDAVIQTRPSDFQALFHLGSVSLELKELDRARQCFQRVQELAPNSPLSEQSSKQLKELGF